MDQPRIAEMPQELPPVLFNRHGSTGLRFEQFYIAVEQSPVATAITDALGRIEFVNQQFLSITGYSRDELLGETPALLKSGMTPNAVYAELWDTLRNGKVWTGELLNRRKCGELYWESETITPVKNQAGEIINFVATKEDITSRRQQENELRLMAAAFETGQATLITDADMLIKRVNQAFSDITGYTSSEVIGKTPRMFKSGRHDKEFYRTLWQALKDTGHWQGEIWNRNKYGDTYPLWQSITAVADESGEVCHYVSVFHNIAERKRIEFELENHAKRDHLTGVYNRRAFDLALLKCINDAADTRTPFVLLMFDIDHFKAINDKHGHDIGDEILIQLANCIKGCLRESDLLARWGGEEFAILLSNTSLDGAGVFAERLRQRVREEIFCDQQITVSVGVAQYRLGEQHSTLIGRVDKALYTAKHLGRDTVVTC